MLGASVSVKKTESDPGIVVPYYNSFSSFRENFYRYLQIAAHVRPFAAFARPRPIRVELSKIGIEKKLVEINAVELVYPRDDDTVRAELALVAEGIRADLWRR
jgi:hypothetical protein